MDLVDAYETQNSLKAFRRFASLRGYPCNMKSDRGPQFMLASKELKQMFKQLDWQLVRGFGRDQSMEWVLTKSADSPWQNGLSEPFIIECRDR